MKKRSWGHIFLDLVMAMFMTAYTVHDIMTGQAAWAAFASFGATIWAFNLLHELVGDS